VDLPGIQRHGKWSIRGGGQIAYDVIPLNFAITACHGIQTEPEIDADLQAVGRASMVAPPAPAANRAQASLKPAASCK